ncbi:MAG: P-loop NTPase fold protein [Myxococcota bacterium]
MPSKNTHISAFLGWYFDVKAPRYAVMLSGDWGVGKTHLIRALLEERGTSHLYISLYGVTNVQQIDDEIFRQLHPVLGSKPARLAGGALKSLLRFSVKLDSVTLAPNASEVELPDFLKNTEGRVLIFDDLERARMPIAELLGHINRYVEHQERHVVVVANELEIRTEERGHYQKTKEKMVGRTLNVVADVDTALSSFLDEISSVSARELVRKHESEIRSVFEASAYDNLRHLRYAFLEFDRLVGALDSAQRQDERIGRDLLVALLCLTFELRAQKIPDLRIEELTVWKRTRDMPGKESGPTSADVFFDKYSAHLPEDWLLSLETWSACLEEGRIDKEKIREEIRSCHYYSADNTPDWIQLWHHHDLSDDRFIQLRDAQLRRLLGLEIEDIGQLAHLLGVFLCLVKLDLCPGVDARQLLVQAIATIDRLSERNMVGPQKQTIAELFRGASHGLGFQEAETSQFVEFRRHAQKALKCDIEKGYPELAGKLIRQMSLDVRGFQRSLVRTNSGENLYADVPILAFCKPSEFIEALASASPESLQMVGWVMRERYRHYNFLPPLQAELPWLKEVLPFVKELVQRRSGKRSMVHLDFIASNIQIAIEAFAKVERAE